MRTVVLQGPEGLTAWLAALEATVAWAERAKRRVQTWIGVARGERHE